MIILKRNANSKMAIGVDTSKWKPRQIKGTPAAKFANILGFSALTIGVAIGAFLQFHKYTENYRKAFDDFYEDPIEEVERKIMIASGLPNRSAETIRKLIEESERPDKPYS